MSSPNENQRQNSSLPLRDWGFLAAIALLVVVTRAPFYPETFYNTDAVQYALAIDRFDIAHHQPHPPGYLFFVLAGRVVNEFIHDGKLTFQWLGTLFSIATVFVTFMLARTLYSRVIAITATCLLALHSVFWFYGIVGESYPAEAFSTTLAALVCYRLRTRDNAGTMAAFIAGCIVGSIGGVRQSAMIFSLPLLGWSLSSRRISFRARLLAGLGFAMGLSSWLLPTIVLTGGWSRYQSLSQGLITNVFIKSYSIVAGADPFYALLNAKRALTWGLFALGTAFFLALFILLTTHVLSRILRRKFERLPIRDPRDFGALFWFYLVWIVPPVAFYVLFFISKPGYYLSSLPAFAIFSASIVENSARRLKHNFKTESASRWLRIGYIAVCWAIEFTLFLSPPSWIKRHSSTHADELIATDLINQEYNALLTRLHQEAPVAAIFYLTGWDWRVASYYHPEIPIVVLYDRDYLPSFKRDQAEACISYRRNAWCASGDGFWLPHSRTGTIALQLPHSTRRLVFFHHGRSPFTDAATRALSLRPIPFKLPASIASIDPHTRYSAGNFIFTVGSGDKPNMEFSP